jgi:hypothetical protein
MITMKNGKKSTGLDSFAENEIDKESEDFDETIMIKNRKRSFKSVKKRYVSGMEGYNSDEDDG